MKLTRKHFYVLFSVYSIYYL